MKTKYNKRNNRMKTFLVVGILLFSMVLQAQITREGKCGRKGATICPDHVIFHETNSNFKKGQGFTFNSINYDKSIYCGSMNLWTIRFGVVYYSWKHVRSFGVPVELCFLYGSGASLLKIAAGYQFLYF